MRCYTRTHRHYCGIDLHARSMYVCVLSQEGAVLLHRNLPCNPEIFLAAIAPFREDLVVAVECIFSRYWVADLCTKEGIAFVLGHALYMRIIHGRLASQHSICTCHGRCADRRSVNGPAARVLDGLGGPHKAACRLIKPEPDTHESVAPPDLHRAWARASPLGKADRTR